MNEYSWIDEWLDDWIDNFHNVYLFHLYVFSTLGQQWLASTPCMRRGRPETVTGGFLLPRARLLLLPHARRWEALAVAAPLLLPRICRRWEALTAAAPLLARVRRRLHRTTRWRCGWSAAPFLLLYAWGLLLRHAWWLLLLRHTWRRFHPMTPCSRTHRATMTNAPTSKRWAYLYELVLDFNYLVELLNV
jgi:hypothetical protein